VLATESKQADLPRNKTCYFIRETKSKKTQFDSGILESLRCESFPPLRFERSEAVERLERLERAAV
jgi:hypothetical protein